MTNRLKLTWTKYSKGYEIVRFDPSLIDWTIQNDGSEKALQGTLPPPRPLRHNDLEEETLSREDIELGVSQVVNPMGTQVQNFDPILNSPDLYLRFANTSLSIDGILGFATDNGLLGTGNAHETVGEWRDEIRRMREVISKWEHLQSEKPVKFAKTYKRFFPFPTSGLTHTLEAGPSGKLEQYLEPKSLLAAMWVQFAGAIEGTTSFSPCAECSNWIDTVPGSNRPDKIYCSDACRMRAYRKRKAMKDKK